MANTYKNIVITPSTNSNTADPKVVYSGANSGSNTDITLYVYPDSNGTLSWEGSAGQLFSITNDLSNNLFGVNDVSGIPYIEVYANGFVSLAPFGGNVVIGNTAEFILSPGTGLHANGSFGTAGQALTTNGSAVYWSTIVGTNTSAQYTWTNTHTFQNTVTFSGLVNASSLNVVNQTNTATLFVTTSANIASSNVIANTSGVFVTNTTGVVNAAVHSVGTSFIANTTQVTISGIPLSANGGVGTAGQLLTTNGSTGAPYWSTIAGVNTSATYTWTNAHTFQNTVTFNSNVLVRNTVTTYVGNTTSNGSVINLYIYPESNGTLSWEGNAGQLFSITNDLSNNLFGVNDVSGIPYIEVYANGFVSIAPFGGNVVIGNTAEFILSPGTGIFANGSLGTSGQALTTNGSAVYWSTISGVNTAAQYTWTNTHTFQNTITFSGLVNASSLNVVNQTNTATLFVTTSANIASSNVIANTAGVFVANSTGVVNAASHTVGTAFTANATVVNAVSYYAGTTLIGNTTGPYGKTEINLNVNSALTANNSNNLGGTSAASYQLNSTLNANIASYLPTYTGVVNGSSFTVGTSFTANSTLVNAAAISVNNFVITGAFTANGSNGSAAQILTSNGSSVYWSNPSAYVRQSFTGDGVTTSFTVTGGYTVNQIDVYVNGIKMDSTDVTTTSGTVIVFAIAPPNNSVIEVVGNSIVLFNFAANSAAQYTWTNTHTFQNTITFSSSINVASVIQANTSGLTTTANIVIGSSGDLVLNAAAGIFANGTLGTSGQILSSNGSAAYWANAPVSFTTGKAIAMAIVFG